LTISWDSAFSQDSDTVFLHFALSKGDTIIYKRIVSYNDDSKLVDAREIIRDNFDYILSNRPEVLIFGEDVGRIGDVNQGCERLQEKFGELRVSDVGIREASIMGQGIGMAMRGLRPIAEIQYLDYFLYGLQILSDDLGIQGVSQVEVGLWRSSLSGKQNVGGIRIPKRTGMGS
jgi:hypothetical protein